MSEDKVYIQKPNGEFNGSLSLGGKKHLPSAKILSRQLHLGYSIETTPEVDHYLAQREKYDKAAKVWSDNNNSVEVRSAYQKELMKVDKEIKALDLETILTGWEIYEKDREDKGLTVDDLPYPKTILEALARSFEEGLANPGSVEGFIPTRYKEFTLPGGYIGYDVSYEDWINGGSTHIPGNHVLAGANVDFITIHVPAGRHKYYSRFTENELLVGFKENEDSVKEGEQTYFSFKRLEALEKDVSEHPRLLKIRSLRFINKVEVKTEDNA